MKKRIIIGSILAMMVVAMLGAGSMASFAFTNNSSPKEKANTLSEQTLEEEITSDVITPKSEDTLETTDAKTKDETNVTDTNDLPIIVPDEKPTTDETTETNTCGKNKGENFKDENADGICDNYLNRPKDGTGNKNQNKNFVDENADGVCDNKGTASCPNKENENCVNTGKGFIDENNDGICDNKGEANSSENCTQDKGKNKNGKGENCNQNGNKNGNQNGNGNRNKGKNK
ncbi:MAG: hypothetical protein RR073_03865 [Clostridia bacterium]